MSQHSLKPEPDGEALLEEALLAAAQELMAVRADADAQVAALRADVQGLQAQLNTARDELDAQQEVHRKELFRLQDQLHAREDSAARPLKKLLGELGPQLQAGEGERSRRKQAELRTAELERVAADAREAHGRAERRAAQLLERVELLEERFAEAATELSSAQEELAQRKAQWQVSEELGRAAVREAEAATAAQLELANHAQAKSELQEQQLLRLSADLAAAQRRMASLQDALSQGDARAAELSAGAAHQAQQLAQAAHATEDLRQQLADQEQAFAEQRSALETQRQESSAAAVVAREALRAQLAEQEAQARAQLDALQRAGEEQLQALRVELAASMEKQAQHEQHEQRLQEELAEQQRAAQEGEQRLQEELAEQQRAAQEREQRLQEELAAYKRDADDRQVQLEALQAEIAKRESESSAGSEQMEALKAQLGQREQDLAHATAASAELEASLAAQREELSELPKVQQQLDYVSGELQRRTAALQRSEASREKLTEQLIRSRQQLDAESETRNQLESDLRTATSAQHAFSEQLDALKGRRRVEAHHAAGNAAEAEALAASLAEVREALLAAENTVEELQAELQAVRAEAEHQAPPVPPSTAPVGWEVVEHTQLENLRAEVAAIQTMREVAEQRHRDEVQRLQAELSSARAERDLATTGAEQRTLEARQWSRIQQELRELREARELEELMAMERAQQLEHERARVAELERSLAQARMRMTQAGLAETEVLRTLPVPALDGRRLSLPAWPGAQQPPSADAQPQAVGTLLTETGTHEAESPTAEPQPALDPASHRRGPTAIQKRLAASERRDRDGSRTSYSVSDVEEEVVFPAASRTPRGRHD